MYGNKSKKFILDMNKLLMKEAFCVGKFHK